MPKLSHWQNNTAIDHKGKRLIEGFRIGRYDISVPADGSQTVVLHVSTGYPQKSGEDAIDWENIGDGRKCVVDLTVLLDKLRTRANGKTFTVDGVFDLLVGSLYAFVQEDQEAERQAAIERGETPEESWAGSLKRASSERQAESPASPPAEETIPKLPIGR
jgi:hypothetical protein